MSNKITSFKSFVLRQQPAQPVSLVIKAGLGGFIAIATLAFISQWSESLWLMAPFGATCVLIFSVPASPLSQPVNVVAGHLISTMIGLGLHSFLPFTWWSVGLAVGLAVTAMAALRITHPPAGADPLVVFLENPGWDYLGFPVFTGSITLVLIAWAFHRLPPVVNYPNKP